MITKYRFGEPYPTNATVQEVPVADAGELTEAKCGAIIQADNKQTGTESPITDPDKFLTDRNGRPGILASEDGGKLWLPLGEDDIVYGLGESLHGMNKRGFIYISNCSDEMHHDENIYSLYGAHNFILIDRPGQNKTALFVDNPAKVTWDIGFTDKDLLTITMEETDYELYVLTGEDDLAVIKEFRALIGDSYVAPRWAFGYGQSRWGYKCTEDIRRVVEGYRKNHLPLDAVYMDIDYMTEYEDFTIDPEKFPNLKDFVAELKEEHIHLVPNVDAAIKVKDGYSVYEEGKAGDYFCKEEDGNTYLTAVWPGVSVLPDYFKAEVRDWFGKHYQVFFDAGLDGFWNDMNEPAMFYSVKNLRKTADELANLPNRVDKLDMYELWGLLGKVNGLANNPEDYRSFYHNIDGKMVRHDKVHNLYGFNMVKGTSEAFHEMGKDDTLLFARASYIGMHRYAGIWTGDNSSFYSHLDLLVHQLPNLNMCGFLFVGADTGGFAFNTSEPLMMRFMELSLFTPLMRNHCALGCREQELYQFKDLDSFRGILKLRYALIPYLYANYVRSAHDGSLMFTPLGMAYPEDENCRHIEDQLLVGEDIMIAPVTASNAVGRSVYLPEKMTLYRFRSDEDYDREELPQGYHYAKAAINEVLVFVRDGHKLYLAKPAESTAEMTDEEFTYLG